MVKNATSFLYANFLTLSKILLIFFCLFGTHSAIAQVVVDDTASGTTSWTVPTGVVAIKVETWGAGGRGGNRNNNNGGSGGGGGGAYASSILMVNSGQTYYYRVGAGSTGTGAGGNTWFGTVNTNNNNPASAIILAAGGSSLGNNATTGGVGGTVGSSIGDILLSGGNGANGNSSNSGGGGAGGGGNANGVIGGIGSNGGGNGGSGISSNGSGNQGDIPGSGGSGAFRNSGSTSYSGGGGRNGRVVITVYYESNIYYDSRAVCGRPGNDGSTVTTYGAGHINTYYPGGASVSAGATSLSVGAVPSNYGTTPIAAGDLLLIIQVQRANINTTDTSGYGSINNISDGYTTGYYEYIVAQNNVPLAGGTLQFRGAGTTNGLKYNYITFNGTSNTNRGKGRYQIIRVPQYSSITLTSTITTPRWNGDVGGIVAMEVFGTLNFNGQTIHADDRGFRGGYSPNVTSGSNLTQYRSLTFDNLGAGKGESIAGTPRHVWNLAVTPNTFLDNGATYQGGYSNGDYSRGAPANAGGGGNSHNAGGGGGANAGMGGSGGFGYRSGWNSNSHLTAADDRGFGGYSLSSIGAGIINNTSHRIFMGGGGGRADTNNSNTGVGGAGGGLVIISARQVSGTGTLRSNGSNGLNATNDGAGGGGAGGTVFLNVLNNSTGTINLIANGGSGGNVNHSDIHGPGGGGGGGAVFYHVPGATVNATANGGASGTHSTWSNHSASAGVGGSIINFTEIPVDLDRFNARCHVITNPMIRQKVK